MSDRIEKLRAGAARCPGQSYGDLLDEETREIPPFMQQESYQYKGSEPLVASRYTSPEFFRQEIEKMWPNVWQFAARDEEMPDPGDYVVYENAGRSYLLTRQEDGSVKAFHNVCLHRGRKLRIESGYADQFRCPFHGFTWNTDGALKEIPCRWDFGHLKNENMGLPEAQVAWWGGYLFIREAEEGPSIEEYLAPLPEFFTRWNHADCVTTSWVGKVIHANWKTTMEAFVEAWHVIETHPQLIPFTGDANTRYNTWGDNANLAITAFATPSPHIDPASVTTRWLPIGWLNIIPAPVTRPLS